jgi:hypothetical protein
MCFSGASISAAIDAVGGIGVEVGSFKTAAGGAEIEAGDTSGDTEIEAGDTSSDTEIEAGVFEIGAGTTGIDAGSTGIRV